MGRGCKYRWSFACPPASHLLLCGPVPPNPRSGVRGPGPRGLGGFYNTTSRNACVCVISPRWSNTAQGHTYRHITFQCLLLSWSTWINILWRCQKTCSESLQKERTWYQKTQQCSPCTQVYWGINHFHFVNEQVFTVWSMLFPSAKCPGVFSKTGIGSSVMEQILRNSCCEHKATSPSPAVHTIPSLSCYTLSANLHVFFIVKDH